MNLISTGSTPTLYRAAGCLQCGNTGYSGRVALYELMPVHGLGRVLLDGSTDEIFEAAVAAGHAHAARGRRPPVARRRDDARRRSAASPATAASSDGHQRSQHTGPPRSGSLCARRRAART